MDGWVDGWVGGRAGLRIAYSNQKQLSKISLKLISLSTINFTTKSASLVCAPSFLRIVFERNGTTYPNRQGGRNKK